MRKPNFIIILSDDQGYGDLSCMGNTDFKTPNIDRLAEGGTRFTDWYAGSSVCAPSRASLMTGCYPQNAGVPRNVNVHQIRNETFETKGIDKGKSTLATALKELDYQTAMFGKWHLGFLDGYRPEDRGFDEWFGFLNGCIDYYSHLFYYEMVKGVNPIHDLWENDKEIYKNGEYFTEMVTERSVEFIRKAAVNDEPFFLFVSYNAPHYPMHAPQKYIERFSDLSYDRRIMAAMLSAMDDGVGQILDELTRQDIREETCIFFQSDNGPSRESRNWMDGREDFYYGGKTGKLKGHKFSFFEGGIRVPAIINWPGNIPAGQVINEPGIGMDIFPTFLELAGGNTSKYQLDGKNIYSMVTDGDDTPHSEIYWKKHQQLAVRRGKWKLVLNGVLEEGLPEEDKVHLADLKEDIGEKNNLKDEYPDIVKELKESIADWSQRLKH